MTDEQERGLMTPGAENYTPLEPRTVERLTDAQVEELWQKMLTNYVEIRYHTIPPMGREFQRMRIQNEMKNYGISIIDKRKMLQKTYLQLRAHVEGIQSLGRVRQPHFGSLDDDGGAAAGGGGAAAGGSNTLRPSARTWTYR